MMHLITQTDAPLEELRRQLREHEITYDQYKTAFRTLPEPAETLCDVCKHRPAFVVQRGQRCCSVCALVERNKRRTNR